MVGKLSGRIGRCRGSLRPFQAEEQPLFTLRCGFQMHQSTILFAAVVLILCVVVVWQFVDRGWSSIQLALADEQTEIFDDMVAKASKSLAESPPDVQGALGYLQYAHFYYPSGTKQTKGSRLDRIVERCRSLAEMRIIQMLRDATGKDLVGQRHFWRPYKRVCGLRPDALAGASCSYSCNSTLKVTLSN